MVNKFWKRVKEFSYLLVFVDMIFRVGILIATITTLSVIGDQSILMLRIFAICGIYFVFNPLTKIYKEL